jgi:nitrate/TMAO reductase-like tetraheme cytochrome c subunit
MPDVSRGCQLVDETREPKPGSTGADGHTTAPEGSEVRADSAPTDGPAPRDAGRWIAGTTIRIALPRLLLNPISIGGAMLAIASGLLIVLFVAVEISSDRTNPYLSIVGFLLFPTMMVVGMIAVPIGALLARRRLKRQVATGVAQPPMLPVVDFNNRSHQRAVVLIAVGGIVALGLVATAGVRGFEFGESPAFCGLTCHRVMKPEYTAYTSSTHARVPCVDCHIGPGTSWFVQSKLTGITQLANYSLNTYPRPIPVPVESLRPSRDTCEQCHWPERLYGDRLQVMKTYAPDERNSLNERTMVFRVGGGSQSEGVHWHVANALWYLPLDKEREKIGWVEVDRQDGSKQTYLDPVAGASITSDQIEAGKRRMDCIDCHNRIAHEFRPYETEVDRAFTDGRLDQSLPFLKAQALALGPQDKAHSLSEGVAAVKARLASLPDAYQKQYPTVYASRRAEIVAASQVLISIFDSISFEEMNVDSGTYPQNIGHKDGGGCDRCHGKLAEVVKGKPADTTISSRCDLCHYAPVTTSDSVTAQPTPAATGTSAVPPAIPHAVASGDGACLSCHGRNDPIPVPVSHAGRTNSMCQLCHRSGAGGQAAASGQ